MHYTSLLAILALSGASLALPTAMTEDRMKREETVVGLEFLKIRCW
jgi:hypothetical protein